MGTFIFFACIVLVVVALLALDWFMAGRKSGRRSLRSANDGDADNANAGYAAIQRDINHIDQQSTGGMAP
jgi:hypothetical protein